MRKRWREEGCSGITAIEITNEPFSWDDEKAEGAAVKNLNFEIKKGELATIAGTVGSGKSSLLSAVIGEMHKISGKEYVRGVLQNKTILFVTHQVDFLHNVDLISVCITDAILMGNI